MLACTNIFGALTRSWGVLFGALISSWERVVSIEKWLRSRGWILSLHVQAGIGAHTASYSPRIGDPSSLFKNESPRSSKGYK